MNVQEIYQALPELETARLRLRKITLNDVEDMFLYGSDPEVSRYVTWATHQTIEGA
ncbi:GNAT family N-acetyltransferase [Falsibacillus albus]|uniref:GNAT family N-acetyltransferase n=1 Tax=Falsibacillus albus TaxID=2478915 RepID=UPI00131447E7|nr:hypothetical protein [Falsibacillus albus]